VTDLAITLALIAAMGLAFWLGFVLLPNARIARRACPRCRRRFGRSAVAAGMPYYERVGGPGVRVMDGPRRYLGARVIACQGCACEFVFGELGGFVEPFRGPKSDAEPLYGLESQEGAPRTRLNDCSFS
jgi:hypothetical protein